MKFKRQRVRGGLWAALAHVLVFHQHRQVPKREQIAMARRVQDQVRNYMCSWDTEKFRSVFRAGEGGANNVEAYCKHLGQHPLHSNLKMEIQAFAEVHRVDVVMYDQTTGHPDWREHPTLARAHPFRKAPRVRVLRGEGGAWQALYSARDVRGGGSAAAAAAARPRGTPRPGPYGSCKNEKNCDDEWTCMRNMCVPVQRALHPPPVRRT